MNIQKSSSTVFKNAFWAAAAVVASCLVGCGRGNSAIYDNFPRVQARLLFPFEQAALDETQPHGAGVMTALGLNKNEGHEFPGAAAAAPSQSDAMNPRLISNEAVTPLQSAMSGGGGDDTLGFSIWIMSDERSQQPFYEKIKEISSTYEGAVGPFLPHVTLLGQVKGSEAQVFEKTRSLDESIAPFRMHFLVFGMTDERLRQLFITIERDRNMTMVGALAEKAFGKTEPGEYMPHLSLAYGNIERGTKTQIADAAKGILDCEFDAKILAVVRTPEELKDWKMISVFSLAR